MRLTPFAVACIFAFPSLTISAPLPDIPIDASSLETRDPKNLHKPTITNLPHNRIPRPQLSKPRRDIYDLYMRDNEGFEKREAEPFKLRHGSKQPNSGNRPNVKSGLGKRGVFADEGVIEARDHQIDMLSIRTPRPVTPQEEPKPKPMTAPKPAGPKPVGSNPVGSKPAGSKPGAGSGMVNKPGKKGGKRSGKRDAEEVMERRDHQSGMLSIRTPRPAARGSTCVPFKCGNTTCVTGQCKKGPKPKPAAAPKPTGA